MHKTALIHILIGFIPLGLYSLQVSISPALIETLSFPVYFGFALTGFLGWRLNQSRILLVSILLILVYHVCLHNGLPGSTGIGKIRSRQILSVALPMALLFVFLTKEARLLSKQSMLRVVLTLSPIALMAAWFIFYPADFHRVASWNFVFLGEHFRIPQFSLISILVFAFVFLFNKDKKIQPFMTATLICMIPFYTMVHVGLAHGAVQYLTAHTVIAFSAICMILLYAILRMYWQRVYVDELTDISNRRALDESLAALDGKYCIAMMDIDHFKKFNDTYGHGEGDNVLRFVASKIEKIQGGKVYRYGGEEFCAVFRNTSMDDAFDAAESVRKNLAAGQFTIRVNKSKKIESGSEKRKAGPRKNAKVTVSIGIARSDEDASKPDRVIKQADNALYKAKKSGRNRVVLAN